MKTQDLNAVDVFAGGEDGTDRISMLVRILHGVNRAAAMPSLGLDFPAWAAGTEANPDEALGHVRIFGAAASLEAFFSSPAVRRTLVGLRRTEIRAPQGVRGWAAVARDNSSDKCKPSYIARQMRARARKGDSTPFVRHTPPAGLALPFLSESTGQSFPLRLKKVSVREPSAVVEFNSYGVCKAGALPQF